MPKNTFRHITTGHNTFSRRWGTLGNPADPYITGYHFVRWSYLPQNLPRNVDHNAQTTEYLQDNGSIGNILNSSTLSVTLPGGTMNKTQINGLGNVKWSAPTNADYDDTVTFKFLEFSGLPSFAIIHGWFRMIRDYRSGVSTLDSSPGHYSIRNYGGSCYYWTTEPNGRHVEFHCCMTGLYPLKDPMDSFGHDITSYDKLELDIDFSLQELWHEDWTYRKCQLYSEFYSLNWRGSDRQFENTPPDPDGLGDGYLGSITGYGVSGLDGQ